MRQIDLCGMGADGGGMRLVLLGVVSRRWVPLCNPRSGRFFPPSSPASARVRPCVCVAYLDEREERVPYFLRNT